MPYFTASSAPRKKSRSVSRRMTSIVCLVCRARISFSRSRRYRISLAWISMSVAWPWNPPIGWWIMTRELGRQKRLPASPGGEQQRAHARRLADAQRRHVGLDELHGVVDRQARRNRAAGRVDVEEDVLVGILRLEEQQLRHDQVGGDLGHRPDQEHHALLQQPRVDVVGALAAPRLLDHHRDQPEALRLCGSCCLAFPVHAAAPISSSNVTVLVLHLRLRQDPLDDVGFQRQRFHLREPLRLHVEPFYYLGGALVALRLLLDQRAHFGGLGLQAFGARELAR